MKPNHPPLKASTLEPIKSSAQKIIFFDGVCHLCNGFVDFVISKDIDRQFYFAPLQGPTAANILSEKDRTSLESVILFSDKKIHYKSDAVIGILGHLGFPYSLLIVCKVIPRFLRDFIYGWVAKNRYAWFGEKQSCRFPLPHEKDYLLP